MKRTIQIIKIICLIRLCMLGISGCTSPAKETPEIKTMIASLQKNATAAYVILEAENGSIDYGIKTQNDDTASNGKYIEKHRYFTASKIDYAFNHKGEATIWLRVMTSQKSNYAQLGLNNQSHLEKLANLPVKSTWQWIKWKKVSLEKTLNILTVKSTTPEFKLDTIIITNDNAFRPDKMRQNNKTARCLEGATPIDHSEKNSQDGEKILHALQECYPALNSRDAG